MAKSSIVFLNDLDNGTVLTPERYEIRKKQNNKKGMSIYNLCAIVKDTITPKKATNDTPYLILDTGDVKGGFIRYKNFVSADKIGSAKKIIKPGDVIISRLRPYLKQVAYVDKNILNYLPKNIVLLCSTEFFILRSKEDISYLASFLLTNSSQDILSSAQEGGHHPRFTQNTLESLKVEENILLSKEIISKEFKESIFLLREGEQRIIKQLANLDI